MPRLYRADASTAGAVAGAFFAQLRTPATTRARIRSLSFFQATTGVTTFVGPIRSASVGATFTTTVLGQPLEPSDVASVVNLDTIITTAPTISGSPVYLDRWALPAGFGVGIVYNFPDPVIIPVSSSVLLWNYSASTSAALNVTFTWEEG